MHFTRQTLASPSPITDINARYLADEQALVNELKALADPGEAARGRIRDTAAELVAAVRKNKAREGGMDAFLQQYDLSSEEGVLLMCIAEALLRIPDADTADKLIADKITAARWKEHLGTSDSLFVNASTWGLMLTGQLLKVDEVIRINPAQMLAKIASRAGEPVVRTAMRQAMRIMGHQFVMGRTIKEALERSVSKRNRAYRYSFDMLGEAALTAADARRYFEAYYSAIDEIGAAPRRPEDDIFSAPSISVKLSALHPRYEFTQVDRVLGELAPRVLELALHAKQCDIAMTVDAEEADRLELSLQVFGRVLRDPGLAGYDGLGLAVQTYQRRASDVFGHLESLARDVGRRIPVRLVKGAYWDTEIKHAQELGLESYPVFTRKVHTDVSYLACAHKALQAGELLYPQFATHNAHTLASVMHYGGSRRDYEFQRLHGMGEELYAEVTPPEKFGRPCRVYAPVGSHKDLLPYLVRRLLENGANTSFVNRIVDESIDVEDIVSDPIAETEVHAARPHPRIPAPAACAEKVAMHKEPTPGATTCAALLELFPELPLSRLLKTILYHVVYDTEALASASGRSAADFPAEGVVAVMCRGDRELNEIKLANHLNALKLELASEDEVKAATGADVGYAGPIGLAANVRLLADYSINGVEGFLCGGNETGTHYLDVHFGRDLDQPETVDFGTVQAGDSVLGAGTGDIPLDAKIEITRGIEVGHIFQLGTKYSVAMDAKFLDVDQKQKPIWMGCYGIGVSRVAASAIEQNHDDEGMIWPLEIAPYAALIVQMKVGDEAQDALCQKLHDDLEAAGIDVLWDERKKVRPGAKFKDADLIGIPMRIVVGRDAADDKVEWSPRVGGDDAKEIVTSGEACERVVAACHAAGR